MHALLDRQEGKASTSAKVFLCIALVGPHLQHRTNLMAAAKEGKEKDRI